ncbi:MAG: diguanylate cyclase [Ruminococcus sp.]|nr:diguanylate cyclase [Ruminococcus sp.]
MAQTEKRSVTVKRVRKRMTFFFTVIMIIVVLLITAYVYIKLKRISEQRFRENVSAADIQLGSSLDNFTHSWEAVCTDALAHTEVSSFDPITINYTAEQVERLGGQAGDVLKRTAAGRSCSDFFIIYLDSTTVGTVSDSTREHIDQWGFRMFLERMEGKNDIWLFSSALSDSKAFYLRRARDGAILVLSCDLNSISTLFSQKAFENEKFILSFKDTVVLSSSSLYSTGRFLPEEVTGMFNDINGDSFVNDEMTAASIVTDCGWNVMLIADSPIAKVSLSFIVVMAVIVSTAIGFLCWLTGLVSSANFVLAEMRASGNEFIDETTGRYNEYGLDEKISEKLETSLVGSTYSFILIGIKDSDQVKTAVTSKYWNELRTKLINISESFFSGRKIIVGRTHTDRIVLFVDFSEFDIFKAHQNLEQTCGDFCKAFDGLAAGEDNALRLYVNIGVSIYPDHAEDFDTLLEKAAKALGEADEKEGDSFVVYDPSKHEREEE